MGALTSAPKLPPPPRQTQQRVVFVQQPAPVSREPETVTETGPTEEEQRTERRQSSLLRRSRGRFGTVLTGFRGILSQRDPGTVRKSLLGE